MCMTPYSVRDKFTNDSIPVPCGKCPDCVARRVSAWSFRLMQQDRVSNSSHFITLTYDTTHVPLTRAGYMSLNKRDVQLFLKRLRKAQCGNAPSPIKYFLVGEYGEKYNRPHYHALLFNVELRFIQPAWALGSVYYGTVTGASVGYTLKYMSKRGKIPMHRNDDRLPEFALMSKRLGANYLTESMINWYMADLENRMYCTLKDGRKITMPRYYKDKLFSDSNFETQACADLVRKRVGHLNKVRLIQEALKAEREGGPNYWRDKAENDLAAFRRMKYDASKNSKF